MSQHLLIVASEIILGASLVVGLFVVVAAALYDLRTTTGRRRQQKAERRLVKFRQPHVTILVQSENDETTIGACLRSIRRSRYHQYDIVVIDNVSRDGTKHIVRQLQKTQPDFPLRLYAKRKKSTSREALFQGFRRAQRGEFVLMLDAKMELIPGAIKRTVARFAQNEALQVVRLGESTGAADGVITIYSQLVRASTQLFEKTRALLIRRRVVMPESGMMCRAGLLKKSITSRAYVEYDSGTQLRYSRPSDARLLDGFAGFLRARRKLAPFAFLFVAAQVYGIFVAATLQSPSLLMFGWLAVSAWMFAAVLADDSLTGKLTALSLVPVAYFLAGLHLMAAVMTALWPKRI